MDKSTAKKIQTILKTKQDGIWGPQSQSALNSEIRKTTGGGNRTLARIQKILDVTADGFWGTKSQSALNKAVDNGVDFSATASSFADPADVTAFNKCKARGTRWRCW